MVNDGLSSVEFRVDTLSATTNNAVTSSGTNVYGTSGTFIKLSTDIDLLVNVKSGEASFVDVGSVVVAFDSAFAGTPYVVASLVDMETTGSAMITISGVNTGSFVAFGYSTAGSKFTWIATTA